ncbi:hypothetical protein FACS1894202_12360 [Clostridia bacterium]|nr:hypothetical protein FACS1894202_12360 [Clostridia bacterium]
MGKIRVKEKKVMDYIALRQLKLTGVTYNVGDVIPQNALAKANVYQLLQKKDIQYAGASPSGTPTLQAVTDAGNTTSNPVVVQSGEGEGSSAAQLSTEQVSVSKYGDSEGMVAPGLLQLYGQEFASSFGIDLNIGIVTGSDDIKAAFLTWLGLGE